MSETMTVQERIYDATMQITGMVDFGLDLKTVMTGKAQIPPQGLRFNTAFQGELQGPKLAGRISGTDYVLIRPDGVGVLDVHAVVTTTDGERIALRASGTLMQQPDSSVGQIRENITLQTASAKYGWVNSLQCWAAGTSDLSTGRVLMKVFAA
jgi:hypothetical protein